MDTILELQNMTAETLENGEYGHSSRVSLLLCD
ncbi:SapB/AmfS family lanthipeptide [Pseudonocardia sp. HH130630-07]|nr:SapB/AmfS family lanthipeptide [Pseudonocardia sp. HH130630-07]